MKHIYLLVLLLSGSCVAFAQGVITVKGTVRDRTNLPLPGATVKEKESGKAVMSKADGTYSISVKSNAVLVFSFLGFRTTEVSVRGRAVIDLKLEDDQNSLEEVVVIGYGGAKRKDITGAVSSVKGEEIAKIPVQDVATALVGRVSGLRVAADDGTPGGTPSITLRGGGSITQSNEPLIVVDGVPQTDGLSFIDQNDIESMEVLKDASAASIYGARGANGVILVTTKQPKSGKLTFAYDMFAGAKKANKFLPVLSPYDFTVYAYEKFATDATRLESFENTFGKFADLKSLYSDRKGLNWQDIMFGDLARTQYHRLSVSGGQAETRFNIFYSRNDDEGLVKPGASVKNVAKINLSHNVGKKLRLNAIVNYSDQRIEGYGTREGSDRFNALISYFQYRPIGDINSTDEDFLNLDDDPTIDINLIPLQNPRAAANSNTRHSFNRTLNVNGTVNYKFSKYLSYNGVLAGRVADTKIKSFIDARSLIARRSGGPSGSIAQVDYSSWNYSNAFTYDRRFNKSHHFTLMAGQEQQGIRRENLSVRNTRFPEANLGTDNLGLGSTPDIPTSSVEEESLLSFFSRVNYSYRERYILTATIRADGSSKFGDNSRWGYFPSAAFAWRLVEEKFLKGNSTLSDAKLRISYGTAGNNRISNYLMVSQLGTGNYPLNNNNVITVYPNNVANKNLKWETTKALNLGLDLGFLKQRIALSIEAYENRTKDLLLQAQIPYLSGFETQVLNIGSTSNKGVELTLNTVNIRNQQFSWNSTLTMGFNRNKVLALSNGETRRFSNSWSAQSDYLIQVGQAVGQMYGYKSAGIYQVNDFNYNPTTGTFELKGGVPTDANYVAQPGFAKYVDLNNDGVINPEDRTVIGNGIPTFTGGFSNTLSYKGFDLSVFINWSTGNQIYNANRIQMNTNVSAYTNTFGYFKDRWTTIDANGVRLTSPAALQALNAQKTVPRFDGYGTNPRFSDEMVEDGSFLRINNVSLGYTLPGKWINKIKLSRARVYVTGYNLHVFSKYSGYDPEVSTYNVGGLTPGVDFGGYPRSRSFVAGLNVTF